MTPGNISILIMAAALVFYIFELLPIPVTAMCTAALMVIFKVIPASSAWAAFSSDSVLLMGGMTVIGSTLFSTGVVEKIASVIEKISGSRTELSIFLLLVLGFIFSAFMNNTTVMIMFLPLLLGLIVKVQDDRFFEQKYVQALSVTVGAGGMSTLVGTGVNVAASSIMEKSGYSPIGFFDFAVLGTVLLAVSLVYIYTAGSKIARKLKKGGYRSELVKGFISEYKQTERTPETKKTSKMLISSLIMISTVAALVTRDLHHVSIGTVGICGAMTCIISGCISFKDSLTKVSWNTLLTLGGTLGCSAALHESGGGRIIAESILNLFESSLTPASAFILLTVLSMVLSQFISNTGTVGILIPIGIAVGEQLGVNPTQIVYGITLAASCSFATPMASHIQAMIIDWGSYKFIDYIKYSGPITVIMTAVIILLIPILFPLTYLP